MAWDKIWIGTTGDYSLYSNWTKISVRTSAYSWTASGSGTNEYYLRTSGSANPSIGGTPGAVYINGSAATVGTAGTLAAGRWAYGDNDALGYSTIYVRLSDGTDPDSKAADYVQFQSIPTAADNVRIPRGSGTITSGLSQSSVAINNFTVENGYTAAIASASGYLEIDPDVFTFAGTGAAYINVGTAAIPLNVLSTATAVTGYQGLYLLGSAITVLTVYSGRVGLAAQAGETSTVSSAVRSTGSNANIYLGSGCTLTGTTIDVNAGNVETDAAMITGNLNAGSLTLSKTATATTINLKGGLLNHDSSGTLGTLNCYSGTADWQRSGLARTVTTINCYEGSYSLRLNKQAVTMTNGLTPQDTMVVTGS